MLHYVLRGRQGTPSPSGYPKLSARTPPGKESSKNSSGARNQRLTRALIKQTRGLCLLHHWERGDGGRTKMSGKPVNIQPPAPDSDKPEAQDDMGKPVTHRKSEV